MYTMNPFDVPIEWGHTLPVIVIWGIGVFIAIKRWREHPLVSKLVIFACAIALCNLLIIPVIARNANYIHEVFYSPLLEILRICLSALSVGVLLYTVFLNRKEKAEEEVIKPDEGAPISRIDSRGIALRILAEIARWAWRLMSIIVMLFIGTFMMAVPMVESQGLIVLGSMALWIIVFAVIIWGWWHEGWVSLILLIIFGIPEGIGLFTNLIHRGKIVNLDTTDYSALIMSMLVGISWSLHTLMKGTTTPWKRRLARITVPVFAFIVIICIAAMWDVSFNFNP